MNKKSTVINNCINRSPIVKKKIKNDIFTICYVSNISKEKGTIDLIKALRNRLDVRLIIAGNFLSEKEDILELIEQSENISYVGFANEEVKRKIIESSDIFCLPSKLEEGAPISIIEAMSYGLPIISTDKGCISDMIKDSGFILPEDYNGSDIINGIEFIKSKYDILSANAVKKYRENYSQEKFIQNLERILKG